MLNTEQKRKFERMGHLLKDLGFAGQRRDAIMLATMEFLLGRVTKGYVHEVARSKMVDSLLDRFSATFSLSICI